MGAEEETRQNTRDISALTNQVTRVTTLVEGTEKRFDSVLIAVKELGEKVSANANMKDELSALREDLRVMRHDMNGISNGLNGIGLLGEKLTEHKTDTQEKITDIKTTIALVDGRVKAVEDRNQRIDGGVHVVEKISGWVWGVLGVLGTLVASNWSTIQSLLTRGGQVGGE